MRTVKLLIIVAIFAISNLFAQYDFKDIGNYNPINFAPTDSLAPYFFDQGCRTAWVTEDLDQDGKPEVLATDYSNGGRIHVFEYASDNKLELVWSSPKKFSENPNSVPRWVRDGDLDGDGNREIIFPVGKRYEGEIQVWEWNGNDNSFGQEVGGEWQPQLVLSTNFVNEQLGITGANLRLDREVATVSDVDGDGLDELITVNQNNKVYIFGVSGDIGGFGTWQIEGGDPAVNPENGFSSGSFWHSIPCDIDGDGKIELVNHHWNNYGFWSIDVVGPDTYRYPSPVAEGKENFYYEYTKSIGKDAVAYMGIQPVDVNGDDKDELAGILYGYSSNVSLISLTENDTGVYVWNDTIGQKQFGIIGEKLWELAGITSGEFWGIGGYDFNENNKDEIYVGGVTPYNIVSLEYKGNGDLFDSTNWDKKIVFPGDTKQYFYYDIYDSVGVKDTIFRESPFISKMFAGSDINNNGKKEIVASYQSVVDSITYTYYSYRVDSSKFLLDSVVMIPSDKALNIRVLEYTGTTGFTPYDLATITPDDYELAQNYPNPFNPSTKIKFTLPIDKKISLKIYDILGKEVITLINDEEYKNGTHEIVWNGTNKFGQKVASGTYIAQLKFGNFAKSIKMSLLK